MTYRDFENIQRSNEEFDGLVVLLSMWAYDNHASYHLHNWDPADDERMMMAIYYAEQVHPFPRYKNDLAKFKADWAAQAYDPGGASLTFAPADVEELEVLCEEAAEPEPEPPANLPKPKASIREPLTNETEVKENETCGIQCDVSFRDRGQNHGAAGDSPDGACL